MNTEPFKPTKGDIAWTGGALASIKEGGAWLAPAMRAVFIVSHQNKTLTLIDDLNLADSEGVARVGIVLQHMGWKLETPNRN